MICHVCQSDSLSRIYADLPPDRGEWWNCWFCGSHVNNVPYPNGRYNGEYIKHNVNKLGFEGCVHEMQTNVWYFQKHETLAPDRTFLDVGCLEGSGMAAMAERGWSVHGFDLMPEAKTGEHVTIADEFKASLFPRQYSAIMAREVVEHVVDWRGMLAEIHAALLPGGLAQVQTPRPNPDCVDYVYFGDHLQIFAPFVLRAELVRAGFEILDSHLWGMGQLWLARKSSDTSG